MDNVLLNSDADINLVKNQLALNGRWKQNPDDNLHLVFKGPALETLWPGLDPIGHTNIDLQFGGDWTRHRLRLKAEHWLSPAESAAIAADAQEVQVAADGAPERGPRQPLGPGS